jgi:UDP-GlcNAc:undecaprenyl-phosphate GlcNAc-1-phosphate transferase
VLAQREGAGLGGILLLGFPLFEAIFLIVVRTRQGRRWYLASRDHTAQRLVQAGFSIRGAVLLLYAAAACCGMGALFAVGRTTSVSSLVAGVAAGCGLLAGWRLAKVRMG